MAALLPAHPGEALWIGGAGGKNHYNVGIGLGTTGGNAHEDFGQDLIEEGFVYSIAGGTAPYNDADKFYLNANGNAVFRINAGAGRTTNNTAHPRSELRELKANGDKADWDGRNGLHYMKGRSRIIAVTDNRPWVCFAQIHGSPNSPEPSDLVRVQLEDSSIVARFSPPSGGGEQRAVLATGYILNSWIDWEVRMTDGTLEIFLGGQRTLEARGMGQIANYFKMGCYAQDNVEKGASALSFAAVEVERGSFVTWHTGTPQPTTPVFTGAPDGEGGPGGGDGTADTRPPTVPQEVRTVQFDQQMVLVWRESTDNVGVDHYNVYRYSADGGAGGTGAPSTVGKATGGEGVTLSSGDKLVASRAVAGADGTLVTGHFRAWLDAAGSTTSRMLVYADDGGPGALLATSDQITITDTAETTQEYPFTGSDRIAIVDNAAYWIAVAWGDPGTQSVTYSRGVAANGRRERADITYGTFPDPFGTATGSFTGPIDAWLTSVSEGTGGGAITTLGKTSNGATASSSSTNKTAVSKFTASTAGTLVGGHARLSVSGGSATTKSVVYADAAGVPGAKLAESGEVVISNTSEDEIDYTYSGANQISIAAGTDYWVGVAWQDPGTDSVTLSRDATAASRQEVNTYAPDPFGTATAQAGPMDAYVGVQAAGAGYVLVGTTSGTQFADTGLTNGVEYTWAVSAEDAAGNESAMSAPVSDAPGAPDTTPPTVPGSLVGFPRDEEVWLFWNASTDDDHVLGYLIYRDGVLLGYTTHTSTRIAGLTNGVQYSFTVTALDDALNESAAAGPVLVTPAPPPVGGVPLLPGRLTGGKVEVAIAWGADLASDPELWTWSDITTDVRYNPGISCSLGRNDEAAKSNPADLTVVLTNTSGDYSLGGRSSKYPNVRRGTPVRVRIDPGDGGGGRVVFLGYADGFNPGWDGLKGNIPVVTLSASGTLRRLAQGDSPVQSIYRRVMSSTESVVAYWPFEEGASARYAPAAVGGVDMTLLGRPDWEADSTFDCSAPLPRLKDARFNADVPAYADTGEAHVSFLLNVPDNGLTPGTVLVKVSTTGTISEWELRYESVGGESLLAVWAYNGDGSLHTNTMFNRATAGIPGRLSIILEQSGSDIAWQVAFFERDYTWESYDRRQMSASRYRDTIPNRTFGVVRHIEVNPLSAEIDATFGHLMVENVVLDLEADLQADSLAFTAQDGEFAATRGGRLDRLCSEHDVPLHIFAGEGTPTGIERMGPQLVGSLLELLGECETADQGQIWDGRTTGLAYTTRRRRESGEVRLTINAAAKQLAGSFEPTDDDQRDRNLVQVTRAHGITAIAEDLDGPKGTEHIGIYDDSVTVSYAHDDMAPQFAAWLVHLGTVVGYRYPSVTVDLAATPSLAGAVLNIVPGDRIDVTGLDDTLAGFPTDTVSLIVEGIAHDIKPRQWQVTFRCSLFSPWAVAEVANESGDTSDMLLRADTDGAVLAADRSAGATTLSVTTTAGALWTTTADDYPLHLSVGGLQVRATACSGTGATQTFTVDALPVARTSGMAVSLWDPRPIGLG